MPHAADKSGEDKDAASDEVDVTPSQSAAVCAALASAITWKLISEGGTPTFTPLHQTPYFSFRQQLFCVLFFQSFFLNPTILYHITHTFGPAQEVSL